MGSKVANILKTVAPLALGLAFPGIGTAIGGALGASGAAAGALGSGILGAGGSLLTGGGLKGALLGGATGALGGYTGGGGFSSGSGSLNGMSSSGMLAQAGADSASGFGGGNALSSVLSGGKLSSYAQPASTIFSGVQSSAANDEMEKKLLEAQGKSTAALSPFLANGTAASNQLAGNLAEGFNPGDLTKDPGYQFNLDQGEQAMGRKQAASGNYYSGAALKDAQTFGQGLADNTYGAAYNRYLQNNSQLAGAAGMGQQAAGAQGQINDNVGNIGANATLGGSNIMNSTLSSLLSGSGAIGNLSKDGSVGKTIIGYKTDGTPIYG